jgi:hypothetical protein
MSSSAHALKSTKIRAVGFSNRSITSAWRLSSSFDEFHFCRNHCKRCNIAAALWFKQFSPDFICYEKIILEIKAVSTLCDEHRAQVLNYLGATRYKLGLLVNFGHYPKLEYERLLPRSHEADDLRL